ncbi:uncharacterized protein [Paralichthys olivaceus]|uniref:uncharacterized protein n=1 Tax=Paralichthys olivaceus TaxID=8255 RepID=UPI0037521A39
MEQMIAGLTSHNMALKASNQKFISMQQAIETRILQNKTEWETKVDALEDHLSCEQVEKEAGFMKMKELERLLKLTAERIVIKHEARIVQMEQMIAGLVEKEAGFIKIKELEKLVSDTEQHEADIKLLILKQIELQELALMTDEDKAKIEREQKKAKEEAKEGAGRGEEAKEMKKKICTSL